MPTENGCDVRELPLDPAGVVARLHAQGITDRKVIERTVTEVNSAIRGLERFALDVRTSLPASEDLAEMVVQENDPFAPIAAEWRTYVPAEFSILDGVPAPSKSAPSGQMVMTGDNAATPSNNLWSMRSQTSTGAIIQADVLTAILANTGLELGYHLDPFVSVFDKVPDWSTRA